MEQASSGATSGAGTARALSACLACAAAGAVYVYGRGSLYSLYFVSGWLLFAFLTVEATRRWWRVRASEAPEQWVGRHFGAGLVAIVLFAAHVDFRLPNGWLDAALTALFLSLLASAAVGGVLALALSAQSPDVQRGARSAARHWICVHIPLTASLLALGTIHGVLAHAHGLLAHVALGK